MKAYVIRGEKSEYYRTVYNSLVIFFCNPILIEQDIYLCCAPYRGVFKQVIWLISHVNTLSTRHSHTTPHTHAHSTASGLTSNKIWPESSISWHYQLYGTNRVARPNVWTVAALCSAMAVIFPTGSVWWRWLVSFRRTPPRSKRYRRAVCPMLVHEALVLCYGLCVVCCECKYACSVLSITPIKYADSDAGLYACPIVRQPILLLMMAF